MASGRGVAGAMSLAALVATGSLAGAPTAAQETPDPDGVAELTVGDWSGIGVASGVATAVSEGAALTWEAGFEARFHMTVTETNTTGTFTLTSSGLGGAPTMKMLLTSITDQTFAANWNISPPAQGTVDGDRTQLVFNAGTVTTAGTVEVPGIGSQQIAGIPSEVRIDNTIEHLECDSANGNWELSVIQQIEDEGWTATWHGAWAAFPVPDPDQQTEAEALIDGLEALFSDFNDFSLTASNAIDPDAEYDPALIDRAEMMELAARATEMANRLHNLSPCDEEAIGAETLQQWRTELAGGVGDLVLAAADALADTSQVLHLDFANLNALIFAADSTGAYGAGSTLSPAEAFQIEDALAFITGQSIEGHLGFARASRSPVRTSSARRTTTTGRPAVSRRPSDTAGTSPSTARPTVPPRLLSSWPPRRPAHRDATHQGRHRGPRCAGDSVRRRRRHCR